MKIFEKCIRQELSNACDELLDPRQHGFINAKSCTTQMVPFTYDLALTLNNKAKCDVIYFDFAKAFDSVSHDLILKKLKNSYRVDGLMLRFIKSYLENRKQQVVIGGAISSTLPVKSGVPQGSILGPLLFVLFINDMFTCVSKETNMALYADDTKIWREIVISEDHFILQNDIDNLYKWSVDNKMNFHPSKCKALSLTNQRNILHNLPFTIFHYRLDSVYIEYVTSQVDLGVTLSNKLLWKEHCDKLVSKANSKLGLLMRTCHFTMDKKQKRTFYLTIVRSTFEHCSIIWHPKSPNQIAKFEAIQKRAIKWIYGRKFDHYKDNEFFDKQKELDILPIKFKFFLNDLALFYKILNSLVSIKLPGHFIILQGDRVRCTRTTSAIISQNDTTLMKCNIRPNCESFKNCFYYRTMVRREGGGRREEEEGGREEGRREEGGGRREEGGGRRGGGRREEGGGRREEGGGRREEGGGRREEGGGEEGGGRREEEVERREEGGGRREEEGGGRREEGGGRREEGGGRR